ncbi:MAG TPA: ferrous iron transport protein B [Prolixibacteraceae bacterium]|nr:ferrous iron transport protein B [Prolixibacteraceae bacterium]
MRLSEVSENRTVVISKVLGHGSFRRRISEMGFVAGKEVSVLKNAPFKDPVEYRLMGYNVSLRRVEAGLIEVVTPEEALLLNPHTYDGTIDLEELKTSAKEKGRMITIALVGNPNCGKTTLFNRLTNSKEHVGNYSGVTVGASKSTFEKNGYHFDLTDLPGTYSLTSYTPEELYTRNFILQEMPDIVVNVVDASNLERNFFLTSQLIDMDIKVVIALNMYDDLLASGSKLKIKKLAKLTGIPIVPTTASSGEGLEDLLEKLIDVYEDRDPIVRHIHIHYGEEMEKSIDLIRKEIKKDKPLTATFSSRYLSINLIGKDPEALMVLESSSNYQSIKEITEHEILRLESRLMDESAQLITDAKYGFIAGALKECYQPGIMNRIIATEKIDKVMTDKYVGFPIFLAMMFLTFYATFFLGALPTEWIQKGIMFISDGLSSVMSNGMLKDLLVDGIIQGLGSVIVFLPNILILFFFISLMEDTGYMARAAFIMDKLMHKLGLHGRSFIPMVMGFGCNVPAIMATRTIRNRGDRLLTMMIIPFMSCSARLPVYVVLISAFFPKNPAMVFIGIYLLGISVAVLFSKILNRTVFKRKETPFVMELPPYRMPVLKNTMLHMWDKASQYLKKIGGTILVAVVLIWALGYFPRNENSAVNPQTISTLDASVKPASQMEQSYLGHIGHAIEPLIRPLGFDWKMGVSLIAGIPAKEIVIGTMAVLYGTDNDQHKNELLQTSLQKQKYESGSKVGQPVFNQAVALSFLVFVLLYFPCIAVIASIKRESGSWKYAAFTVLYTTAAAWIGAFITYNIALFFI